VVRGALLSADSRIGQRRNASDRVHGGASGSFGLAGSLGGQAAHSSARGVRIQRRAGPACQCHGGVGLEGDGRRPPRLRFWSSLVGGRLDDYRGASDVASLTERYQGLV
jgi:hypothetical protein